MAPSYTDPEISGHDYLIQHPGYLQHEPDNYSWRSNPAGGNHRCEKAKDPVWPNFIYDNEKRCARCTISNCHTYIKSRSPCNLVPHLRECHTTDYINYLIKKEVYIEHRYRYTPELDIIIKIERSLEKATTDPTRLRQALIDLKSNPENQQYNAIYLELLRRLNASVNIVPDIANDDDDDSEIVVLNEDDDITFLCSFSKPTTASGFESSSHKRPKNELDDELSAKRRSTDENQPTPPNDRYDETVAKMTSTLNANTKFVLFVYVTKNQADGNLIAYIYIKYFLDNNPEYKNYTLGLKQLASADSLGLKNVIVELLERYHLNTKNALMAIVECPDSLIRNLKLDFVLHATSYHQSLVDFKHEINSKVDELNEVQDDLTEMHLQKLQIWKEAVMTELNNIKVDKQSMISCVYPFYSKMKHLLQTTGPQDTLTQNFIKLIEAKFKYARKNDIYLQATYADPNKRDSLSFESREELDNIFNSNILVACSSTQEPCETQTFKDKVEYVGKLSMFSASAYLPQTIHDWALRTGQQSPLLNLEREIIVNKNND